MNLASPERFKPSFLGFLSCLFPLPLFLLFLLLELSLVYFLLAASFSSSIIESEILAALENCTPTKKEFGIFGMGMLIKFAPSSKKEGYCDFLQRVSFPPVTATVNDVQKETPATTKETRCRLSFDKMKELVQKLKNSQETDEENKTFIPKEWLENPELCASREFQTPPQTTE